MLRWSYSTDRALRECARQVAYRQVVGAHNARDSVRREAYVLRQIQSVRAWQGSLVHQVLATEFAADVRAGAPPNPFAYILKAQDLARRQFAFSAARRYRDLGQTKTAAGDSYAALAVHEWGLGSEPDLQDEVDDVLARGFTHLAGRADLLAAIYAGAGYAVEMPLTLSTPASVFVVVVPDLVFVRPDGGLTVIDWKMSRLEDHGYERQLRVYAYALMYSGRWPGLTPSMVELYEVNLLRDQVHRHHVDDAGLAETAEAIRQGGTRLREVLGDGSYARLRLDKLEIAADAGACAGCAFAPLCRAALDADGRSSDAETVRARVQAAGRPIA